ncbi:unnamed protein product [Trifolium pratense]|uniref:Uncharacterized protein n=1 Tax=Trifolium pratense TaxID=57577 RepID=A0ACB0J4S7_TRIPR|nr:unnamed protein product [Trifolium pratense]
MAEMAVSFAVDKLLPLLGEETNLLRGIHKEFADIKDELESIQAFLKDADKRAAAEGDNMHEGVKIWVKQVREAAFRIEDIIDDYLIQMGHQPRDFGCAALQRKLKTMIPRYRIAHEIQNIKSYICGIKERSERYGFQIQASIEQGSSNFRGNQNAKWHDPRMDALYIDLQQLTKEESLELFNKKAFKFNFDECCPKELIDISSEIARKCKGLPLAIVAIGGLLSTKERKLHKYW